MRLAFRRHNVEFVEHLTDSSQGLVTSMPSTLSDFLVKHFLSLPRVMSVVPGALCRSFLVHHST